MLSHEPIINPRNDTIRESLFLKAWQKYHKEKFSYSSEGLTFFDHIFPEHRFNQERASQVAASFMVFMGCNAGLSFTYMADKLHQSNEYLSRPNAFLAMWAVENKREGGINSGVRYVESFLTPRYIFEDKYIRQAYFKKNISIEDYEMVEEMVKWWGGFDADNIQRNVHEKYVSIQESLKEIA